MTLDMVNACLFRVQFASAVHILKCADAFVQHTSCVLCISAGRATAAVNDVAVTLSTSDILFWLTGSRQLPAVGFSSPIKVHFCNDPLPHVSTCGLYVQLPVHRLQHARSSVKVLTGWILDSPGFGHV